MNSIVILILKIAFVLLLILIVGFFAGSETAFLTLSNIRIRQLVRNKRRGVKKVSFLKNNIDSLLTLVLIGANFINTLAAALTTEIVVGIVGDSGIVIATFIMTFVVTIFGQIIPKTIALDNPEKTALKNAPVLYALNIVLFPFVWFFSSISKAVVFIVSKIWKNTEAAITEKELKALIDVGENEGTLEKNEKIMLDRIFEVSDLHVRNIMKHRSLVQKISYDATREQVIELFRKTGYSRFLVYQDTPENIIGVLDYKNVLFYTGDINSTSFVMDCVKEPMFVPETLSVIELIQAFKKEKRTFAIALDEQGSTAGIVTRDDLLRAVFGRMTEEYVNTGIEPEQRIKVLSANEFILPGDMKLSDVNRILNLELESDEYNTLGGWLLEHFDALPSTGEALKFGNMLFVVKDQAQRRIQSIYLKINILLHTGK